MGTKTAIPLILILAVSAAATPFVLDLFEDGEAGEATPSASPETADARESPPASPPDAGPSSPPAASEGSADGTELTANLLEAADPTSPAGETIRSRLAPLTATAPGTVEPLETPEPVSLYQATLAHPAATMEDRRYVESLGPLPQDLDLALARVVLAHGVASQQLAQPEAPADASLRAAVTMAHALDRAMPTLEDYVDHPIWDRQTPDDRNRGASTVSLEAPPLGEALVNLYAALGFGPETLDAIRPEARAAAEELGPAQSRALARVVTAQAGVQRDVARSLLFVGAPASHSPDAADETAATVEDRLEGTPLSDLTAATQQLRAALAQAEEVYHGSAASEPVLEEPWVDPLGLVVVGTRGNDTFGANAGGAPVPVGALGAAADDARSSVGRVSENTSRTVAAPGPVSGDEASAEATADVANDTTVPGPGWHMLVLDTGGSDTYRDNAGGIDAGGVLVQAEVDSSGALTGARTAVTRGDEVCVAFVCEPTIPGFPEVSIGRLLQNVGGGGPRTSTGPVPTGLPLTATVADLGGDDRYEDTGRFIQGSARGLAVGLLYDAGGDDTYRASELAQGASEVYGTGILADDGGDDTYNATARAQGWAKLPSLDVMYPVSLAAFGSSTGLHHQVPRTVQGSLIDVGGHDTYLIEDDLAGQGVMESPQSEAVSWTANVLAQDPNRATARLVDVGGPEHLPVPTVEFRRQVVHLRPSYANVSEEDVAHFWYERRIPESAQDEVRGLVFTLEAPVDRFKTAVHADPGALPDPVGDDAITFGSVNVTCREYQDEVTPRFTTGFACGFSNLVDTPSLFLFGEPDAVQDPPALTLTFGGDTSYNGTIASRTGEGPPGIRQLPRTLVDLEGDDNYTGDNETIGHVDTFGTALLVDREGADRMVAGNRSVAHVEAPVATDSNPVAAVIDLDGDLTVRSANRSQAHAEKVASEPAVDDLGVVPSMALLDAGGTSAAPSRLDGGQPEQGAGGLDLVAGNRSQGYSEGVGVGVLVGSTGDDRYHVDGWGQGVHRDQQILRRFCQGVSSPQTPPGVPGTAGGNNQLRQVNNRLQRLNAWLGGIGLLLDPDGDDSYTVEGDVGMGDASMDSPACPSPPTRSDPARDHVSLLGLGSLLDVRGRDDYRFTESPTRPPGLPDRSCSGANRTECEPRDDRAWVTMDEENVQERVIAAADYHAPATMGLGVDNVRNAHHLATAACRNYDPAQPNPATSVHTTARDDVDDVNDTATSVTGSDRADTRVAGPALLLECDETLRAVWQGYLRDTVRSNLPVDRRPELRIALPRSADAVEGTAGGSADVGDEAGPSRLPVPAAVPPTDDPEPAFLEEAGQPRCEDRERGREVSARGGPDVGCLSVTRDLNLGQWVTDDPGSSPLDPGDTVGCNCSVRLRIEADHGETVRLTSLDDDGLYPSRGRVTTFTTETHTWYDAYARFRVPLTVDEPIQDGNLRGDFVEPEAAADFPINLSRLPSGLSRVEVTAVVEDTAAEETGGAVPAATNTWSPSIVHQRPFDRALATERGDDGAVFLSATGPVAADRRPTLELDDPSPATREALLDNGWEETAGDNFTRELPIETVIDGPSRPQPNRVVPQNGIPGCAALVLEENSDGEGVCWTGDRLVVGLPVGEADLDAVERVRVGGRSLPVPSIGFEEFDVEPRLRFQSEEDHRIRTDEPVGSLDVRGLPGTKVLPNGTAFVEELLDDRVGDAWAQITVEPDGPGSVGIEPATPTSVNLSRHDHEAPHRAIGDGPRDHAHVEVWRALRADHPVVLDRELVSGEDTERHVQACLNLDYAQTDEVRSILADEIDKTFRDEFGGERFRLRDASCVVFSHGDELTYLVPLGENEETRLVRLRAQLLGTDGEIETEGFTAHVDPVGPQGQLLAKPTASGTPETNVRLQLFPQTAEPPRITSAPSERDAGSDLAEIELQARTDDANWTTIEPEDAPGHTTPWEELPTPRRPSETASVSLDQFVDANESKAEIKLRGLLTDESNNTMFTKTRRFFVDRTAPNATDPRVVVGADQARLMFDVDEAVHDIRCAREGCPLEVRETLPGTEPEPFLALSRADIEPRSISVPILDVVRGPSYNVSLVLEDPLGNTAVRNLTLDTFTPLDVDASPMADTLVNKTATLNWTERSRGDQTLSTFTSAYLMLPSGPCALLKADPGVVTAEEVSRREAGPVSVRGEAGEDQCEVPDEGLDATLLLYSLAPNADALAFDRVPVHVDTTDPAVNVTGPAGWINRTGTVRASASDALPVELDLFVDGEPREADGASATARVQAEGVHDVLARATDASGNEALNRTKVRIDRTPPAIAARVLGVRGGLALVNATATDEPSGIQDVQLLTASEQGPRVPGVGGRSVLLSVPVEPGESELVLRARDQASNVRDVRLSLDDVPRIESGPLASGLDLATPSPDTLDVAFDTTNETSPVVIVDAGPRHVERLLEPGTDHEVVVDGLSPGRKAEVTVALPRGGDLVPALNATTRLPEDAEPPSELRGVHADPTDGGVRLSWEPASDDVGVREVVIERDGREVARTASSTYVDEPRTFQEHTYTLAAVDVAGNRGPAERVQAKPLAHFAITNMTTEPETLTPDEPVTVQATVQTPAGLDPDVVTLGAGDREIPMRSVEAGPYRSTYEVRTRLPALNMTDADPGLTVTAQAGDRSATERFPAPVVATAGVAGDGGSPSEVPGLELAPVLSLLAAVAVARRRWSR